MPYKYKFLDNPLVVRLVEGLTPWFLGKEQDSLLQFGDGLVEYSTGMFEEHTEPLYDFRDLILSPAGASAVLTDDGTSIQERLDAIEDGSSSGPELTWANIADKPIALVSISTLAAPAGKSIYTVNNDTYATYSITPGGRAMAANAGTANTVPYYSESNVVTMAPVTATGRALWNIDAIANTLPYFNASSAVTTTALTSHGRELIGSVDAAATRAAIDFYSSVRLSTLAGYTIGPSTALTATDTVLGAFGKLQSQISAVSPPGIPSNPAGNYTLTGSDGANGVQSTAAAGQEITIPPGVMSVGVRFPITRPVSGTAALKRGAGVVLKFMGSGSSGSDTDVTLGAYSAAWLWQVAVNTWHVWGSAISEAAVVIRNILSKTEEFENAVWSKDSVSITPNATTAPDGTITADRINLSSGLAYYHVFQRPTVPAGVPISHSIHVKRFNTDWVWISPFGSSEGLCWFNVNTGAFGTVAGSVNASVDTLVDGWYRLKFSTTSGSSVNQASLGVSNSNGALAFTATGVEGVYIWGAQTELSSTPTAYQKIA